MSEKNLLYYNEEYNKYSNHRISSKLQNVYDLTDEEKLEKIDIKTIENFLRKKKLKNIIK